MIQSSNFKKFKHGDEEDDNQYNIFNTFKLHKNHIYFYSSVDKKSCLELNYKINYLNKELLQHSIEYDMELPNIYLHINSYGGCLFDAFSTIDTILNSKIPIISIIEGCAASAATIISMVCHKRYATLNALMLIHQLSAGSCGKYEELKDEFINDTKLMNRLYNLYKKHTKMNINKIKNILKRDIWWDVNECKKNGLIDDIWYGNNINYNTNTKKIKVKKKLKLLK
jgi:ATP-dependent protease ClpP protease subunit